MSMLLGRSQSTPHHQLLSMVARAAVTCMLALLVTGGEAAAADPEAQRLLVKGCLTGDLKLVKTALGSGASINETWGTNLPLYYAAGKNQVEAVRFLLTSGADINGRSGVAQRSALHEAALRGHFDVVRMLVEARASINIRNTHGRSPLYYVTSPPFPLTKPANAEVIAKYLIAHGGTL